MSGTKGPLVLGSRTIVNTTEYFNMTILELQITGTVNTESKVETIDYSVIGRAHMV